MKKLLLMTTFLFISLSSYSQVPANDNCSGAIAMTVNSANTCTTTTSGTSVGGTSSSTSCTGTADDDVWYSFVATSTSQKVTVSPVTMSNVVFQVFSQLCFMRAKEFAEDFVDNLNNLSIKK